MQKPINRKVERLYIETYKMMAFFEEVIEKIKLQQYDRRGLILYNTNGKKVFYFVLQVNLLGYK